MTLTRPHPHPLAWALTLLFGAWPAPVLAQQPAAPPAKAPAPPVSAAAARQSLQGFEGFVDSALAAWKVVGASVGIIVDGQVVYSRGHGLRDLERKLPVTPASLFAIGSTSKAFTVFALGTLVDQGRLEWDRPLVEYMPDMRFYDPDVTLRITPRDLVTHRSGLPRHDLVWYNNFTDTRDSVIRRIRFLPPSKDLRETYQYNNLMFLTAGVLAGRLMQSPWEDAIRKLVFEPLGMAASNFSVRDSERSGDFSRGYQVRNDSIIGMPFRNIDLVGPAGSINSSGDDLLKWVGMHLSGGMVNGKPVINRTTLADMYAPHMPVGGMPTDRELGATNYGMAWSLTSWRGRYQVQHGGNIDGFSALVAMLPLERVGIVVLSNQNGSTFPGIVRSHALDRILGLTKRDWNGEALAAAARQRAANRAAEAKKETARVKGTRASHSMEEYAGDYYHPGYGMLTVGAEEDRLVATYHGIVTPLEHWHYDVFSGLRNPADPTFTDMKYNFRTNLKGNIEAVAAPFESAVAPIGFERLPDRRLRDPLYLGRFVGRYALANDTAVVALRGNELTLSQRGAPVRVLDPDRGSEFNLRGITGISVEFVMDQAGTVTMARFKQPNGVFEARRVE